jgi:hypothetical protein
MVSTCKNPLHCWRLTLQPDPQEALEKALRHERFDLWYGSHYLRFTKTRRCDGTMLLRLQERARLVDACGTDPELHTEDQLSSPFVYEETVSVLWPTPGAAVGANVNEQKVLEFGRLFFDRAARRLDRYDDRERASIVRVPRTARPPVAPSHHLRSEQWYTGQSARIVSVGGEITLEDRAVGPHELEASLSRANRHSTTRTERGHDN